MQDGERREDYASRADCFALRYPLPRLKSTQLEKATKLQKEEKGS
jgi:hypothetical protein